MRLLRLVMLLLVLLPASAAAQVLGSTDIIIGRVTGPDGRPLEGAQVQVTSLETEVTRSRLTDANGRYTILFPDGGGEYRVSVRFIGMLPAQLTVVRHADEDRLVADVQMSATATVLGPVTVRATQRPAGPERPTPGSTERALTGENLQRLPIDASDPAAVAALAPGVVGVDATDSTAAAFSVAGQRPDLNSITLDGITFGAGVPEEAVRMTRVITNTFDVSRGQFAGGQISSTTRGGTNTSQGSFGYSLRDPALQWTEEESELFGRGFTQHQVSGGLGAPIRKDRLLAFGSFQLRRRSDPLQALTSANALTLERLGISADSVDRFLEVMRAYGLSAGVPVSPSDRIGDNVTLLGRLDYVVSDAHTLMLRGDWRWSDQDASRVGPLAMPHNGGESGSRGGGAMVTLSSTVGRFINELRAYGSTDRRRSDPYLYLPEGRVRVASELETGVVGVSTLEFGGDPAFPQRSRTDNLEVANELSWISTGGAHRFKLGGLANASRFSHDATSNRFGTFTFQSLADLEAGQPASFTRSLTERTRDGSAVNASVYLGDTWRFSRALQVNYGLRLEGSRFGGEPAYNPAVDSLFGRRTDDFPGELRLSPRAGFTWTIFGRQPEEERREGEPREGQRRLGFRRPAQPPPVRAIVRGGIGEFRGRPPTGLFTSALDATGLPRSESQLTCLGDAVPVPEWDRYLLDPSAIPTTCAGGAPGPVRSGLLPNVTLFDSDFGAPRSWRASLGVQRRVHERLSLSLDGLYARGASLYGVRDLNLDATPRFTLPAEGHRPVFVAPEQIVPASGAVGLAGSRVQDRFGHVFEVNPDLRSETMQLTAGLNGFTLRGVMLNLSYTLSRSRDQSSFSCCSAQQGFASPTTAGDPNRMEWARSDLERRHSVTSTLTYPVRPWLEVTMVGRLTSGAPFTPRIGGDVNGDGVRNDRAFVFDPVAAGDTALANGMTRLLASAPEHVRDCLAAQMGTVASRNSCSGPWWGSLDLRANLRPSLGRYGRRLTLSLIAVNPLTGVDQLLHGSRNPRGWGQPSRPDATLLHVRGFDPDAQRFIYQVNERFGDARGTRTAIRAPFQVAFQGRWTVGPDRARERMTQMLERAGGRGGRGGVRGGSGADAGPLPAPGADPRSMLERLMPNPVAEILALRDTLGLSDEQAAALGALSDSLAAKHRALADTIAAELARSEAAAVPAAAAAALRPHLESARAHIRDALRASREVLTPAQWERLPASVRTPGQRR